MKFFTTYFLKVHSHSRGKKYWHCYKSIAPEGILPRAWEKARGGDYRQQSDRVYSHVRGKKRLDGYEIPCDWGILPRAWEKDLVFMGKTSISSSFCHEIFYNKSHEFLHHSTLPKLSHSYIV